MSPPGPIGPISWLNRRTLTWASFDIASSCYFGIAPPVLFPIYFQSQMAGSANATAAWGLAVAASVLLSGLTALAAAAASRRISRYWLIMALMIALVGTLAGVATGLGQSALFIGIAYVVCQACYFGATASYESYLPEITARATVHRLSGFGWALGYVGGVAGIVCILALAHEMPDDRALFQQSFAVIALVTTLIVVPVMLAMWSVGFHRLGNAQDKPNWTGIAGTLREWRRQRSVYVLLIGITLLNGAMAVVLSFTAPILSRRFGQSLSDLLVLILAIQALSMPTTYAVSLVADRLSRRFVVALTVPGWAAALILLAYNSGPWVPWAIVVLLGCCVGTTGAALRGLLAEAIPLDRTEAFFAISTVGARIASALGPVIFVGAERLAGERTAFQVMLFILAAGAVLIFKAVRNDDVFQDRIEAANLPDSESRPPPLVVQ
jgi:MFS transporter, UMF1 family